MLAAQAHASHRTGGQAPGPPAGHPLRKELRGQWAQYNGGAKSGAVGGRRQAGQTQEALVGWLLAHLCGLFSVREVWTRAVPIPRPYLGQRAASAQQTPGTWCLVSPAPGCLASLSPAAISPPSPCPNPGCAKDPSSGFPHSTPCYPAWCQSHTKRGTLSIHPPLTTGSVFSSPTCATPASRWRCSSVPPTRPRFHRLPLLSLLGLCPHCLLPIAQIQNKTSGRAQTRCPPSLSLAGKGSKDTWRGLRGQEPVTGRNPPAPDTPGLHGRVGQGGGQCPGVGGGHSGRGGDC